MSHTESIQNDETKQWEEALNALREAFAHAAHANETKAKADAPDDSTALHSKALSEHDSLPDLVDCVNYASINDPPEYTVIFKLDNKLAIERWLKASVEVGLTGRDWEREFLRDGKLYSPAHCTHLLQPVEGIAPQR
ncbi:hypothetical protein C8R43DRAFT_950443 [Mycena crocata]|nr:hypothetical protein C8R43DRAFT_950443 [Mycena crocata]